MHDKIQTGTKLKERASKSVNEHYQAEMQKELPNLN